MQNETIHVKTELVTREELVELLLEFRRNVVDETLEMVRSVLEENRNMLNHQTSNRNTSIPTDVDITKKSNLYSVEDEIWAKKPRKYKLKIHHAEE